MDPISLIASVAGIGTAAVALSQAMFNFLDNASNAHHEIEEIAMELSDFSSDIETLRKILNVNQTIYTAQYVDRVQRIIASFRQFEKAIYDVIGKHGRRGKRQKLRVAFGMTKLDRLRGKVETLKRSLSFMVTIVQLALSQRDAQMSNLNKPTWPGAQKSEVNEPQRLRKIAETLIQANRRCVIRLQEGDLNPSNMRRLGELPSMGPPQLYKNGLPNDTATWFYQLVFDYHLSNGTSSYDFGHMENPQQIGGRQTINHIIGKESRPASALCNSIFETAIDEMTRPSQVRSARGTFPHPTSVNRNPFFLPPPSNIWHLDPLKELDSKLHSWTTLSGDEIRAISSPPQLTRQGHTETTESINLVEIDEEGESTEDSESDDELYEADDLSELGPINLFTTSSDNPSQQGSTNPFRRGSTNPLTASLSKLFEPANQSSNSSHPRVRTVPESEEPSRQGKAVSNSTEAATAASARRPNQLKEPWVKTVPNSTADSALPNFLTAQPSFYNPYDSQDPHSRSSKDPFDFSPLDPFNLPPPIQPHPYYPLPSDNDPSGPRWPRAKGTKSWSPPPPSPDPTLRAIEGLLVDQKKRELAREAAGVKAAADAAQAIATASRLKAEDEKVTKLKDLILENNRQQLEREKRIEEERAADRAAIETAQAKAVEEQAERQRREVQAAVENTKLEADVKYFNLIAEEKSKRGAEAAEMKKKYERQISDVTLSYEERLAFTIQEKEAMVTNLNHLTEQMEKTASLKLDKHLQEQQRMGYQLQQLSEETKEGLQSILQRKLKRRASFNSDISVSDSGKDPQLRASYVDSSGQYEVEMQLMNEHKYTKAETACEEGLQLYHETGTACFEPKVNGIALPLRPRLSNHYTKATERLVESLNKSGTKALVLKDEPENDLRFRMVAENPLVRVLHGSIMWEHSNSDSELGESLFGNGWKPIYVRGTDKGQTWFLGQKAVHVYFFKPDYQPQLVVENKEPMTEYLVIGREWVEQKALDLWNIAHTEDQSGHYYIEPRLSYIEIKKLVELSMMYREANVRKAIRGFSLKTTPESAKIKLPSIDFLTGKPNSIQETESKIDSDVNLIKARSTDSSILSDSQSEQLYDQEHASDEANASTAKEPPSSASNYIQGENLKVSTNEIWDESLWQEYSGSEAALEAQVRLGLNFGVSSVKRRKRKVIKLSREEASKLIDGSESDTTETTTVTEQFEHSQAQYAQYAQYAQLDGWARSPFISQPMYPDWQRTAQSIPQVQPPPPAPSPPPRVSLPISHSEMSFSPSSGWQPSFFPGPYLPDHAHRVDTLASTHTASVPPTPIGRSIGNIQSQPPPSAVSSKELSISGRSNQPLAGPPAFASPGPASIVDPSHPSPQAPYTISSPKASSITSSPTPLSPPPPAPSGPLSPVACPIESAPSPPPPPFLTTFPDPSTESPQSHGALIDVNYSPCSSPPLVRPRERDQESDRGWSASGSSKARKKKKTARKARARSPSEDKIQERDQDGDSDSDDWNTTTKRKRGKKTEATLKLSTGSKNVTIEEIRSSSAERGVSTSSHQYRPILS